MWCTRYLIQNHLPRLQISAGAYHLFDCFSKLRMSIIFSREAPLARISSAQAGHCKAGTLSHARDLLQQVSCLMDADSTELLQHDEQSDDLVEGDLTVLESLNCSDAYNMATRNIFDGQLWYKQSEVAEFPTMLSPRALSKHFHDQFCGTWNPLSSYLTYSTYLLEAIQRSPSSYLGLQTSSHLLQIAPKSSFLSQVHGNMKFMLASREHMSN